MPRKRNNVRGKRWSEEDVEQCFLKINSGCSIRKTAAKYGMSEGMLRHRLKMKREGKISTGGGKPTTLTQEAEQQLAKCIKTMCNLGFSLTSAQIKDIVQEYVRSHELKTCFKHDRPGKDWLRSFTDRNQLSMKKLNMICSAKMSTTANPFNIYNFYETLKDLVVKKKLEPSQIWNCVESGFPHDPQKCQVIQVESETTCSITCGTGQENMTTLAVCSASGRVLAPLIVFVGKNLQADWQGNRALPGTFYGISDDGSMNIELFGEWFDLFINTVTERPLVLIYDGHLTHVSIQVIMKAIEEDITILKVPSHVTDKLRPMGISFFLELERAWEVTLNTWLNQWGLNKPMKEADFVDHLCDIWHEGLSPAYVKCFFRKTGIYPVDSERFPKDEFDRKLLERYELWVTSGKSANLFDELATSITPRKLRYQRNNARNGNNAAHNICATPSVTGITQVANPTTSEGSGASISGRSNVPTGATHSSSTLTRNDCDCATCKALGPVPITIPGKVWVPVWTLQ